MGVVERLSKEHAQLMRMQGLGPHPDAKLRVLSLGAGVQSSTMALLACRKEIEPGWPDAMIFADTDWEPRRVYEWLDWLEGEVARLTDGQVPVYRVSAGNLRDDVMRNAAGQHQGRATSIPLYIDVGGAAGPLGRSCTRDYKITPIRRKMRELLCVKTSRNIPANTVETWIGISTDEAIRARPSKERWEHTRWPLIELGMSRQDCLNWFAKNYLGRIPPKSSCIGCPFHNDREWRALRDSDPQGWADAVEFDAQLRAGFGLRSAKGPAYLHRSLKPLNQVDLSTAQDRGQLNLFMNECEGMCGV